MRDEGGTIRPLGFHSGRFALCAVVITAALLAPGSGCTFKATRDGLPSDVEATIGTISDDIAQERYEKIYNEASDLWKQAATLEQSTEVFKQLRSKLGQVENRSIHSATEQNNSGGPLKGRAFIVTYQTRFEKGDGMETFTLAERDHKWLLARYFVNSTALN
ncbi:MAG TPA: DUF4019 domain-containing protein [Pyrinomonadaceae bacterium]|nr:DUF4019 domain-containing protein [Pyrinomonadaceae bacterium]